MSKVEVKGKQAVIVGAQGGAIRVRYDDGSEESVRAGDIRAIPATEAPAEASAPVETETKENDMEAQVVSKKAKSKPAKAPKPVKAKAKPAKAPRAKSADNGAFNNTVLKERSKSYQEGKISKICGDDISMALDGLKPDQKVRVAAKLVEGVTQSAWAGLNGGQKAMNAANRLRGALNKGTITITAIRAAVKDVA